MLIENCLQQIDAGRAARKARWCLLTADTFQPQISFFLWYWLREIIFMASDSTGVPGLHSKSLQWNTHPCSYLWSIAWSIATLVAFPEPVNEVCVKSSWRQVCLCPGRRWSRNLSAPGRSHLACLPKRGLWSGLTWARLETGEGWLLWGFEETQTCVFSALMKLWHNRYLGCSDQEEAGHIIHPSLYQRIKLRLFVPTFLVFPWLKTKGNLV